jgi:cysteine desulfurase
MGPGSAPPAGGRVYLDHASTSPLRPEAAEAMAPWLSAADPGRVHNEGRSARLALEEARASVAELFGTRPRQVIFTSGATEAVNAACFGALWDDERGARRSAPAALAAVEHSAVREATARWAATVMDLTVDGTGRIDPGSVTGVLEAGAALVHCQMANHEVGTLQPVGEVAEACRGRALVHVDAAAAAGRVPIDFDSLGVDLLSVSAHKMGGPRGMGAMLVRRGLRVPPLLVGGAQERARRAGLENVAAAAGFGAVARTLLEPGRLAAEAADAAALTDRLRSALASVAGVEIYGPPRPGERLPHLVCLGVAGVEAEPILIGLDQAGVAAHSGSSCSSEMLEPSPVLQAMGLDADHSLRLSVGWSSRADDIGRAVDALTSSVARLRGLRTGG